MRASSVRMSVHEHGTRTQPNRAGNGSQTVTKWFLRKVGTGGSCGRSVLAHVALLRDGVTASQTFGPKNPTGMPRSLHHACAFELMESSTSMLTRGTNIPTAHSAGNLGFKLLAS